MPLAQPAKLPGPAGPSPRDRRYQKFRYKDQGHPPPLEFPVEEEVPENPRHRAIRTALFESAEDDLKALVSTDQFVYWDPTDPGKRLAPDFFVHLGATARLPDAWKIWAHGLLDVAAEIISPSDARDTPWLAKLGRYRQIAIKELYRFDAADPQTPLRVWDWQEERDDLVERELESPRCAESPLLGLYFVVVEQPQGLALRLARDAEGRDLLPTRKEQKARETERAQKEAERAQKEAERAQKETERAQKETERAQKEAERAQKEAERAQKEAERADQAEVRVRRDVLRGLLHRRGLLPSAKEEEDLAACGDPARLDQWILRAATAVTPAEVFANDGLDQRESGR